MKALSYVPQKRLHQYRRKKKEILGKMPKRDKEKNYISYTIRHTLKDRSTNF